MLKNMFFVFITSKWMNYCKIQHKKLLSFCKIYKNRNFRHFFPADWLQFQPHRFTLWLFCLSHMEIYAIIHKSSYMWANKIHIHVFNVCVSIWKVCFSLVIMVWIRLPLVLLTGKWFSSFYVYVYDRIYAFFWAISIKESNNFLCYVWRPKFKFSRFNLKTISN